MCCEIQERLIKKWQNHENHVRVTLFNILMYMKLSQIMLLLIFLIMD